MDSPMLSEEDEEKGSEGGLLRRLLKARIVLVSEVVTDKLARRVQAQALIMDGDDAKKPITVLINSPGGSADSGFAIIDLLRFVRAPVRTVVNGLCASAAVMIALSAPRERRWCTPNSRYLLHQPSTMLMGSASDIAINANEIVKMRERYNEIVAKETGKTVQQVTQDADRDFWLSPGQAKEYGLVSRIVTSASEIDGISS